MPLSVGRNWPKYGPPSVQALPFLTNPPRGGGGHLALSRNQSVSFQKPMTHFPPRGGGGGVGHSCYLAKDGQISKEFGQEFKKKTVPSPSGGHLRPILADPTRCDLAALELPSPLGWGKPRLTFKMAASGRGGVWRHQSALGEAWTRVKCVGGGQPGAAPAKRPADCGALCVNVNVRGCVWFMTSTTNGEIQRHSWFTKTF